MIVPVAPYLFFYEAVLSAQVWSYNESISGYDIFSKALHQVSFAFGSRDAVRLERVHGAA